MCDNYIRLIEKYEKKLGDKTYSESGKEILRWIIKGLYISYDVCMSIR